MNVRVNAEVKHLFSNEIKISHLLNDRFSFQSARSTMKGAFLIVLSVFAIIFEGSAVDSEGLLEELREGERDIPIITDIYVSKGVSENLGKGS